MYHILDENDQDKCSLTNCCGKWQAHTLRVAHGLCREQGFPPGQARGPFHPSSASPCPYRSPQFRIPQRNNRHGTGVGRMPVGARAGGEVGASRLPWLKTSSLAYPAGKDAVVVVAICYLSGQTELARIGACCCAWSSLGAAAIVQPGAIDTSRPRTGGGDAHIHARSCVQSMKARHDHQPARGHRQPGIANRSLHCEHGTVRLMIGEVDRLLALILNDYMDGAPSLVACRPHLQDYVFGWRLNWWLRRSRSYIASSPCGSRRHAIA